MSKKADTFYYDNFIKMADCGCRAAGMLDEMLGKFEQEKLKIKEIHTIEHEADDLNHSVMTVLSKAFITPIEREDIMNISRHLDDIVDNIEDVVLHIYMCNVKNIRPEAIKITGLVIKSCEILKKVMKDLPNFKKTKTSKKLKENIIEINRLEEEGDKLFIESMHLLYTSMKDPIELMAWRDIFNYLERCLDACEETADVIEGVMMKNS